MDLCIKILNFSTFFNFVTNIKDYSVNNPIETSSHLTSFNLHFNGGLGKGKNWGMLLL